MLNKYRGDERLYFLVISAAILFLSMFLLCFQLGTSAEDDSIELEFEYNLTGVGSNSLGRIYKTAFLDDNNHIVFSGTDNAYWNIRDATYQTLNMESSYALAYDRKDRLLAYTGEGFQLGVYQMSTNPPTSGTVNMTPPESGRSMYDIQFGSDSSTLFTADGKYIFRWARVEGEWRIQGSVYLYNETTRNGIKKIFYDRERAKLVAFIRNGDLYFLDSNLTIEDIWFNEYPYDFNPPDPSISSTSCEPLCLLKNWTLLWGRNDRYYFLNLSSRECISFLAPPESSDYFEYMVPSHNEKWLAMGYQGSIDIVDMRTLHLVEQFRITGTEITALAWSLDDSRIATVDDFQVAQIRVNVLDPGFNRAPTVSIEYPLEGDQVSNTITTSGHAQDDHGVLSIIYQIDNSTCGIAAGTSNWSLIWDTRYSINGWHRIRVRAFDGEKLSSEAVVNVFVRNDLTTLRPPAVTIDEPPDGSVVSGNIEFVGRAWGPNAITIVKLYVLETTANCSFSGVVWRTGLDTRILPNGSLEFRVKAFDGFLWSPPAAINLTIRNNLTRPNAVPWVVVHSPTDGQILSGIATARGIATDPEGKLRFVLLKIDGGEWIASSTLFEWTFDIDCWKLADGPHRLSAMCADDEHMSPVVEVTFSVDNDWDHPYGRPRCRVDSPANGSVVSGTVTVEGTADDDAGVLEVLVSVSGGVPRRTIGTEDWSFVVDTSTFQNGPVHLRIWASDGIHNSSTVDWALVVRNDRPPSCFIVWPVGNQTLVENATTVTGTAVDPEGATVVVEIRIDGGEWTRCEGGTNWSYDWNLADVRAGNHTVQARAFDGALYSPTYGIELKVLHPAEPTMPPVTKEYGWWPLVLAIIVVLVAIAISAYAIMRAKRKK